MDMAFLRRTERLLADRQPPRLDFALLIAMLAARQTANEAVRAHDCAPPAVAAEDPLVELLLAGPGWRKAASAQRGCFSRAEAGRRVNGL